MVYTVADAIEAGDYNYDRRLGNTSRVIRYSAGRTPSLYSGGFYGATNEDYRYAKKGLEVEHKIDKAEESYDNKEIGKELNLKDQIENIQGYMVDNRKDEASQAFQALVATLRERPEYAKSKDKEIISFARELYKERTGQDIVETINENCSGGFAQGLCGGLTFGIFSDSKDAEDLKEEITGRKRTMGDKAAEITGNALGMAASGAGVGAGVGAGIGALFFGAGAAPGAAIGAGIGAICGVISGAIKGCFS